MNAFRPWLLVLMLLPTGCAIRPIADEPRPDALFSEWNRSDSPGCSVAVIQDGAVIYSAGFGMADLEHNVPLTPDSVFYIGSVSKQFVAFTIFLLESEGRLSLDDEIQKYLPDFPRYAQPITIRHLIHHTSGLRDYLELWLLTGRDYLDKVPMEAAYELVRSQRELNFPPGTRHLYSNTCYLLLPLIVEKVTGQRFKDFARERIFEPLGMARSHFHDDNAHLVPGRAFGYRRNGDGSFGNLHMRFDLVGSGGLYTTVEDLAKWDANFYDNRLGGGPALIERMLQNGRLNDGSEVAYAAALVNGEYRGLATVSHSGALGGYRAQLLRFPAQRFSVVILSNLESFDPTSLAYRVADLYLEDRLAPPSAEEAARFSIEPEYLGLYSGRFDFDDGHWLQLWSEEGALSAQVDGGAVTHVIPLSRTEWRLAEGGLSLTFLDETPQGFHTVIRREPTGESRGRRVRPEPLTPFETAALSGVYYSPELATDYQIGSEDGALFLKIGLNAPVPLRPVTRNSFSAGFVRLEIQPGQGPQVDGFRVSGGRVLHIAFRRSCQ